MRKCGRPRSHTSQREKKRCVWIWSDPKKRFEWNSFPSWAHFYSFMPQNASHKWPSRPPADLGHAANKWECSFIGHTQLERLSFEKELSENRLFVFPLMSLQPNLNTHTH